MALPNLYLVSRVHLAIRIVQAEICVSVSPPHRGEDALLRWLWNCAPLCQVHFRPSGESYGLGQLSLGQNMSFA